MKAVIMAGGEGSRLRPLTCACPKPMVPILDRPVMQYALELLNLHGVSEAAVTLMYLPERIIDYFGDGGEFGVRLTYYTETHPLGTAGSVRQAKTFLNETFCVLSGDGLTDCDLTSALKFHQARGALATMVLKKVKDPLEYGVVCTSADGRIQRFVEKPGWGEVCSDAVNTGIYLLEPEALELIPADKPYDFGRELFPRMVADGLPVFGYAMEGYWCDVGDVPAYLRAHADLLDGRMKLGLSVRPGAVNRMPGASVDKSAVLEAPCYIGSGARVEAGACIGPYTVLGAGSVASEGASLKRTVLWRGAQAGARTQLRGTILQSGAKALPCASAFEESVLGDGSELGEGAVLMPTVRVWPRKQVSDGERVDQNVVWGGPHERRMSGGQFVDLIPSQVVRSAQSFAEALGLHGVCVSRDESTVALACQKAALAGLMAQGVQVVDVGTATLAQLREAIWDTGAQGGLHIARSGIQPLNARGARLNRNEERKVLGALAREDYTAPFSGVTRAPAFMGHTELTYAQKMVELTGAAFDRERAPAVAVYSQHEQLLSLCERVFRQAGCVIRAEWEEELMELAPGEIGLWLSDSGEHVDFADTQGILSEAEHTLLLSYLALESGEQKIILPRGATRGADAVAAQYGATLQWISSDAAEWQRALFEESPFQFRLHFDGLFTALLTVWTLYQKRLTLREILKGFPHANRRTQLVPVELRDKGRLLRILSENMPDADASDGLLLERDNGWAWISPAGDRRECLVVSESSDVEFARDLCDFCTAQIQKALKTRDD